MGATGFVKKSEWESPTQFSTRSSIETKEASFPSHSCPDHKRTDVAPDRSHVCTDSLPSDMGAYAEPGPPLITSAC